MRNIKLDEINIAHVQEESFNYYIVKLYLPPKQTDIK